VALVARRRDKLDELARTIGGDSGKTLIISADVASAQEASLAVERAADLVTISSTAGRVARPGSSVYNLTKFGVAAFSEALRQELIAKRVRVSVIEPGTVATELATHLRAEIREAAQRQTEAIQPLLPEDIADAVAWIVTRDRRVAVNEILVRASEQTW
jgi:NADP-dependent 3-hydroxy acid dehydrogenase YdfG